MAISEELEMEIKGAMINFGINDNDAEGLYDALWSYFAEDL